MASTKNNIIIKDRDGNDVVYEGVSRIRTGTTDGSTKEFVIADDIPNPVETTVELDFSDGDMVVTPSVNTVYEKVTISKPDNLTPSNIVRNVNVAGVIGTSAGGIDSLSNQLQWFTYQIDYENETVVLWRILYDVLYEKTGSYDVVIPNKIGDYDVMISCF